MSTYPGRDAATGRVVALPMYRKDYGDPAPPCHACAKARELGEPGPVDPARDFGPWVADVLDWYREARAVGDFGRPSPVMRAAAAAVAESDRRADRRRLAADLAGAAWTALAAARRR